MPPYTLITPARNEAAFIPALLTSIINQTVKPIRWVIVSDSSTDETDTLVSTAVLQHPFITLLRVDGTQRSFSAKAAAFACGYETVRPLDFAYVGNLDADITLTPDYYERLLGEMERKPNLGIASGSCWEKTPTGFRNVTVTINHSVGAVQFFRRTCFEEIGGYQRMSVGGIDSIAVLTARMQGWQTRVFPELKVYHHKPIDSASASTCVRARLRAGMTEYHIGTHPVFACAKAIRRWSEAPAIASTFIRLYGYFALYFLRTHRDASPELVRYVRAEQKQRLREWMHLPRFMRTAR